VYSISSNDLIINPMNAAPTKVEREPVEWAELTLRKTWILAIDVPVEEQRDFTGRTFSAFVIGFAARPVVRVRPINHFYTKQSF
jgi:hypothetical protein